MRSVAGLLSLAPALRRLRFGASLFMICYGNVASGFTPTNTMTAFLSDIGGTPSASSPSRSLEPALHRKMPLTL
jgi:hypothetical protein